MGLFDRFRRIKDPVRATARVVSATAAPEKATAGACRMNLVVSLPGHPAFTVDDKYVVPVAKWPAPGTLLPIEASQARPTRFKILWDEVTPWAERAAAQAQAMVDQINRAAPAAPHSPHTTVVVNGRAATPEEIQSLESSVGMDLDGDGRVADSAAAATDGLGSLISQAMAVAGASMPNPAGGDPTDRITALERLTALRDSGALTQAEFDAEKARLLGS